MGTFGQDLRYGLRQLQKSPGFTAIAVLTLGLGIAINATMFSLVSAFLLRRPPGQSPDRIAVITSVDPAQGFHADVHTVSAPNYLAWRETNRVFSDVAAADEFRTASFTSEHQSEALHAAAASPSYFTVFGVSAQLGRTFQADEDQPGKDRVVVLSHELWQRRFGSDASLIGRTIRLNREPYTVIGVMPENFRLLGYAIQLWMPLTLTADDRSPAARKDRSLHVYARLKPAVTIDQARAEMITLARQTEQSFPEIEKGWGITVRTLPDFLVYDFGIATGLAVLMTTVGFVLLIACGNVAGLLLARATGRRKELAIRRALGAGRFRVVRQLLTEGLVIAVLGGAWGLLLAQWGIRFLRANLAFNEAIRTIELTLDWHVLLFAAGVSVFCAVLCALAPALSASRTDITTNLKEEGRAASPSRSHSRSRTVLVTGEIALALFLLIGSGLLFRAIFLIEHQNLGFRPDHLLTAGLTLDNARYKDASSQTLFVRDLLSKLQHIPGSEEVAAASDLPATGPASVTFHLKDQPDPAESVARTTLDAVVTPDYFRAAGISLLRGRVFVAADNAKAPRVVVVSQEFARRFLADQDALGKQIRLDISGAGVEWTEIIGIVANVKSYSETAREDPQVYEAYFQRPVPSFSLMIRTASDPNGLAGALYGTIAQMDVELPLANVMSMPSLIQQQSNGDPFFTRSLAAFACLALILAAIGIYGLISYSVGQRSHEIGIRMALGARRQEVMRMILGEGIKMASIGGAIGLVVSLPLPKVFGSLFSDIRVDEPWLYFIVPAVILIVTLLATYIPARRAAQVEPMQALRQE